MSEIRVFRYLRCLLFILLFLPAWSHADDFPPEERQNIRPGRYYGTITLTFREFMEDSEGRDPHERGNATVYLYGVTDATKNKEWCGHGKTMELINFIGDLSKRVDKSRYDERAADVIVDLLRDYFPCKKEKSK